MESECSNRLLIYLIWAILHRVNHLSECPEISSTLKSCYWQIPMEESSKKYTTFGTPDGAKYEFNVMPFGLKNALTSFQKLLQHVLVGYIGEFTMAYLDDIVIFSEDLDQHQFHLRRVLERFRVHGLHCGLKKMPIR